MKILALDVSARSTGVSVVNKTRLLKSSLQTIQTTAKKSYGERLSFFESEIKRLIKKHKPDVVAIEDIFRGPNAKTFSILSYFRGVALKAIWESTGKEPISISASQVRSLLDIKNTKKDAFQYINDRFALGFDFEKDNDIADSIALGLATWEMKKKGIDEPVRSVKRKKRRRRKRNKKGVSKTGS